ncbi:MAG: hypothetical protein A3I73_00130 [Omnitrophica bacterium RIFCSPLOWO2_02_FULL_45_16]|nr:MAG: hypothetical protein A3C51_06650 [Omnitrophica bacterium RIFCSPHIGHO2_02_FULL_46_20]OGW94922.1 MAG: hypothetical protein A3K16_05075 [Omnitrophica bacterium RIFCSPLOWO2_01_FULL_45_24]OGX01302.1 MAG: hypothetical protein A3I73_00130 [Omnitrophica bacterium RIFCSPLOWO2_02_FULL_45_16]
MESNISIRGYEAQDKEGVFSLLSSFYANMDSERSWEHLYMDNPYGRAIISLAQIRPEKNIMGHYSVIKMPMTVLGREYMGGKGEGEIFDFSAIRQLLHDKKILDRSFSADLLSHTVTESLKEGLKLICTNPSDLALKSHLEAGFKVIKQRFDIFIFVFSAKYFAHLLSEKAGLKGLGSAAGFVLAALYKLFYRINILFYQNGSILLEPFGSFNAVTDELYEKFSKSYGFITIERKQAHLNWRFGGNEYIKFIVKVDGQTTGYIVLHIFENPNGFKEAAVVDYLVLPHVWSKFAAVIVEILKVARKNGCDFLRLNYMYDMKERFMLSGLVKKLRFIGRPDNRNIVVFLSPELKQLENNVLDAGNWYFTDLYFEDY